MFKDPLELATKAAELSGIGITQDGMPVFPAGDGQAEHSRADYEELFMATFNRLYKEWNDDRASASWKTGRVPADPSDEQFRAGLVVLAERYRELGLPFVDGTTDD